MTQARKNVIELCNELMTIAPEQITIDLVQDVIEEVAHLDDPTPDDIGSAAYQTDILKDVYNPKFEKDIHYLDALYRALKLWGDEAEATNKALGLDPNK